MTARPALDVSHLPAYVFGPRGLMWWGTLGLLAIEGTMFAILIAAYFYLRLYVHEWPLMCCRRTCSTAPSTC